MSVVNDTGKYRSLCNFGGLFGEFACTHPRPTFSLLRMSPKACWATAMRAAGCGLRLSGGGQKG
eukprot:804635-Prorocentrum_minimum.AAC.1